MHALETCPSASSSLPRILDVTADIVADVLAVDTPRLQLRALQRDDAAAVELLRTCDDAPTWLHVPFAVMAAVTEEGSRLAFVMRSERLRERVCSGAPSGRLHILWPAIAPRSIAALPGRNLC
jgi:hypothetical protein